jgi:hypothetical protein
LAHPKVTARRMSAHIFVPKSECTQATLRETESVASTTQDENHRCGSIGSGRDPSNLDTRRHERGGSRCEPMRQWCTCRSTTCALRTPRALPRRCLNPNHPRRMSGDRLSSHAPTCFREHHRRVDRRHAGLTGTGFDQRMRALRTRRDATCQPSWVRNLNSHRQTIFPRTQRSQPETLSTPQCAGTRKWSRAL